MSLKISRILHAGYIFTKDQTNIVFDPIFENPFSQNCYAFPSVKFDIEAIKKIKFSAVFISHYHDDHLSFESLNLIDRETPCYIYCIHEEIIELIRELGFKKVLQLEINESIIIDNFKITPRKALDADVDSLFQIQVDNLNILNVVDSWIDDDTLKKLESMKPWNLILWPFQLMRELEVLAPDRAQTAENQLPIEWIQQLKILEPEFLIPSSCQFKMEEWSWYNQSYFPISYKMFEQEIFQILPASKIIRLQPSQSIGWNKNYFHETESIGWIIPEGSQNVDYLYDPQTVPTPTSDIAQHFAELTENQESRVFDFCENELVTIFNALPKVEDSYFYKPHTWALCLWDHRGKETLFYYDINDKILSRNRNEKCTASWSTEIPINKLYNAIESGESLSSLYIRILNSRFDDLVEDPLLRCLYNGKIGSYQKAQLKRIKTIS